MPRGPHNPPAFLLYANDWFASTTTMTLEAQGAYMRLLCYQWDKGSIPTEPRQLAGLLGLTGPRWRVHFLRIWDQLASKFVIKTITEVRSKRSHKRDQNDHTSVQPSVEVYQNARLEEVRAHLDTLQSLSVKGGRARAASAARIGGKFAPAGWRSAGPAGWSSAAPAETSDPSTYTGTGTGQAVRSTNDLAGSEQRTRAVETVEKSDAPVLATSHRRSSS